MARLMGDELKREREKFAAWLRKGMAEHRSSSEKLAKVIGESVVVVRAWRGERRGPPTGKRLAALEKVLGSSYKEAPPPAFNLMEAIADFRKHVADNMGCTVEEVLVTIAFEPK